MHKFVKKSYNYHQIIIHFCFKERTTQGNQTVVKKLALYIKEVDLGQGIQPLQITGTFVFSILHQSHVSIKITWIDFILFQMKA